MPQGFGAGTQFKQTVDSSPANPNQIAIESAVLTTDGRFHAVTGTYFKAIYGSPGDGAGVTSSTTAAFSATSALFGWDNLAPSMGQLDTWVIPDYVKLTIIVADAETAAGALNYCGVTDTIKRFSSGGYQPISPELGPVNGVNMNGQASGLMPFAAPHLGAVSLVAGSANRLIHQRGVAKVGAATNLFVVGDQIYFSFGTSYDVGAGAQLTGTTAAIYRQNVGYVVIPPQGSYYLLSWVPNITTAFKFEFEMAWWELAWPM